MAKFKFKYGVMNSGKSQELHRIWYSYTQGNQFRDNVLVLTHPNDTRNKGMVKTRAGQAILANHIWDIFSKVNQETTNGLVRKVELYSPALRDVECILVDEIQFFTEEEVFLLKRLVLEHDIPVIAFGLLKDFQNNIFEGSQAALIVAEEISEVETKCKYCNKKAIMNLRVDEHGLKIEEGEQIVAGDNDMYYSVCHQHYNNPLPPLTSSHDYGKLK